MGDPMDPLDAVPGDVVQADPTQCRWGAVFVVVTDRRPWGVIGYFLVPGEPGLAYVRLKRGSYVRIGCAQWWQKPEEDEPA